MVVPTPKRKKNNALPLKFAEAQKSPLQAVT